MEKIFVLHVKKGYEDREAHIDSMMDRWGYPFEYVLDGDIPDFTDDMIDSHFAGDMTKPQMSCALKHIIACRRILDGGYDGALIMEDDMVLFDDFEEVFSECVAELRSRGFGNALVSMEDSALLFVPRSERIKGFHLYEKQKDRFTGAYYCTRDAAAAIVAYVESHKCHKPIDLFHTFLAREGIIHYYWCHPCIATQGTHTGLFASSINKRSASRQRYRRYTWKIKMWYKKMLFFFR